MEKTIEIPEGVQIDVTGKKVTVKGKKGSLSRTFSNPLYNDRITIEKADGKITVKGSDERKIKACVGAFASHIKNMAMGVMGSYVYKLKIHHTHFPIQVEIKGKEVIVKNFLGERSIRRGNILGATKVELNKDVLTVTGINKEDVGQTAANIEGACRLAGKDRRVFLDGIYITGWEITND